MNLQVKVSMNANIFVTIFINPAIQDSVQLADKPVHQEKGSVWKVRSIGSFRAALCLQLIAQIAHQSSTEIEG
jgi:hypothetical protein